MSRDEQFPGRPDGKTVAFGAAHAHSYAEGPPRQVPGFSSLHRMVSLLLAERIATKGRVLVLGAGGGLELKALAEAHPGWSFDGVDPSADMLALAARQVAPHAARIRLHRGYIETAPPGPFDGATALLTLHFIAHDHKLATLRQVHARLAPGAPFVLAHLSFSQAEPERALSIARHLAFGGTPDDKLQAAKNAIAQLPVLSPEEDEKLLGAAGFSGIELFYAGLGFRGWVGYA